MRIALKVDVDTLRGTREGVPALLRLLERYGVRATFLFSLGPDHTGRALRRVFRRGFLSKVFRTSVTSHYGLRTLMYGTLLPGPHIGRRGRDVLRAVAAAGHEVGIHCHDHVRWQDAVARRDAAWTRRELERAQAAFVEAFGRPATVHGAAGWQVNPHLFALEEQLGFRYASDVRGEAPFLPRMGGVTSGCPQLPTTLPTLDELIGREGITAENVHEAVLRACREPRPHGHVYTLHAELEGMRLQPVLEHLLQAWRAAGDEPGALADLFDALDAEALPRREVLQGTVPGRSGALGVEGPLVA
ncbi:MAG TPA: polysaccharide deacetylase family protein [bacterium]|nr:polysaccharide deacetylase family protein [bacterium]